MEKLLHLLRSNLPEVIDGTPEPGPNRANPEFGREEPQLSRRRRLPSVPLVDRLCPRGHRRLGGVPRQEDDQ